MAKRKKIKYTPVPDDFCVVDIWTEYPFLLKEDGLYIFTNPVDDLKTWNDVPKNNSDKQDTIS